MKHLQLLAAIACLSPGTAIAQAQPPSPQHSAVAGLVIDSLRARLLPGALVLVEGTGRAAITDQAGRFRIDSVPPGAHRIVLLHSVLDSVGIQVVTPPLDFVARDTTWLELSLPSPETLVRVKCGEGPFPHGSAALFGLVVDSETEEPLGDASVMIAWTDVEAARETGIRRIPRQRTANSAADGTFRICGLPSDLAADMLAWHGTDTTGVTAVALDHPLFAIVPVAVPKAGAQWHALDTTAVGSADSPSASATVVRRGNAVLRGMVTTVSGAPVPGARVSVHGADGVAVTGSDGRFTLPGQPSGSQTAIVRKLGYEPVEFAIILASSRPQDVDIRLAEFVPTLETVLVEARRSILDAVGFTERQRRGAGTFLTHEDIERRSPLYLVDLFANVPSLRVVSTGGTGRTVTGRGGCVNWFVDDMPWLGGGTPAEYMHPHEVAAAEVYSASSTPTRYARSGGACETIVLWTKTRVNVGPR